MESISRRGPIILRRAHIRIIKPKKTQASVIFHSEVMRRSRYGLLKRLRRADGVWGSGLGSRVQGLELKA